MNPQPKAPKPVRSEAYRRLVASLPCFYCGVWLCSQAAHPNTDKAKGKKASDLLCFPLCSVSGRGCHEAFDQYRLVPKADMPDFERRAVQATVRTILASGNWPRTLPIPDLREFN